MKGRMKTTIFLLFFLTLSGVDFCDAEILVAKPSPVLRLKIADSSYGLSQKETLDWFSLETRLSYNPSYLSEIENSSFCQKENTILCELTWSSNQKIHIQKRTTKNFNASNIQKFLEILALKTDKEAEDAKFKMENGRVSMFSLSKKGIELDQEKSLEKIIDFFRHENGIFLQEKELALPYKEISPDLSIDSIDSMGIKDLIGQGKSNFRGSTNSRIHNIKVATARFNGLLIKPKEEFSFVKILGEVDGEHGYLPELVIKKDKTEPEFGGGICQVSTTAFRAAIYSGLEITARRNHAYPVSYYNPQGMDATVYVPRPDLRFVNNTPGYILIQTEISGTELTFNFYGTSDGRKVEVDGPTILEKNADGSMKTTFSQKVIDKDNNVIINDVFNSNYDSPSKYPHPTTTSDVLTEKPKSWSDNEWKKYKKEHGI